jgi:proline iminopeptidase
VGTVVVNGIELFYVVDGDGPPCLVPHGGLGVDHTLYRHSFAPLAATNRLVFWDHRANGRSGGSADSITIPQLADDAAALGTELGFDRFNLLGHSYGGFVSQELVLRHPDRVARLVLSNTTPGQLGTGEDPDAYAGEPPPDDFVELVSVLPGSDDDYASLFAAMIPYYFHDPAKAPSLADVIFRVDAMLHGFMALSSWSSVDRLGSVGCPTLLVGGRHDLFTGWRQQFRIGDRIPGATVEVLDDSGHFPWLEEPDRYFPLVQEFLTSG